MDYKNYPSVVEISDLILQRVYAFQGNIISFSYFQGFCSFVLTNCNSEEIVEFYKNSAADYICEKYNWDYVVNQTLILYKG